MKDSNYKVCEAVADLMWNVALELSHGDLQVQDSRELVDVVINKAHEFEVDFQQRKAEGKDLDYLLEIDKFSDSVQQELHEQDIIVPKSGHTVGTEITGKVFIECPHCGAEPSVFTASGIDKGCGAHNVVTCDACGKKYIVEPDTRFRITPVKELKKPAGQDNPDVANEGHVIFEVLCGDYCQDPTDELKGLFYLGHFPTMCAFLATRGPEIQEELQTHSAAYLLAHESTGLKGVNFYPSQYGGFHVFNSWDVVAEHSE